jgi:Fe-S cluster assembly protein SufD
VSAAVESLDRLRAGITQVGPAWLVRQREQAWSAFVEAGLPTRRLEAWKSTNLAPLAALDFAQIATASSIATGIESGARAGTAIPGVRIERLADVLQREPERLAGRLGRLADPKGGALVALSTALLEDGVVIELAPGARCDTPIRIRFAVPRAADGSASASFPRLLVLAGEDSAATVFVELDSAPDAAGFTDLVAELALAPRAHVALVQLQAESAPRIHFSSLHAEVDHSARLDSHVFTLADGLVRSELDLRLIAPGAEATLDGFFLVRGAGHADHFTTVDHAAPHCTSSQEYRGVMGDRGKGVFRGRVVVRPDAQKTNASQSNPNLLLSDHAAIDTRPQLEIYADDVRASHGSTIGQLDADALFFLRARGIGLAEARVLLTRAFARAIVDGVAAPTLRAEIGQRIDRDLAALEPALEHPTGGRA